jgi:hypothetical protein
MFVILAVFYLFTGLARCSVDPEISYGTRKLTRTPRVKKKKRSDEFFKNGRKQKILQQMHHNT